MDVSSWNVGHALKTAWKWSSWSLLREQEGTKIRLHFRYSPTSRALFVFCVDGVAVLPNVTVLPNVCKFLAKWIKTSQSILLFLHRDHFWLITSDTRAWLQPSNDRQETYAWSKIYRQTTNHVFTKTRSSNHHYTILHYSNHRKRTYNNCSASCWLVHILHIGNTLHLF